MSKGHGHNSRIRNVPTSADGHRVCAWPWPPESCRSPAQREARPRSESSCASAKGVAAAQNKTDFAVKSFDGDHIMALLVAHVRHVDRGKRIIAQDHDLTTGRRPRQRATGK